MIKQNNSLVQPAGHLSIWRYMNFAKFHDLVIHKSLFFTRLDKFPDNFEGTLHELTKKELYDYRKAFAYTSKQEADGWTKAELANIESYKAHILANCWSLSEEENYALWKVYLSGSKEGVAIRSTVNRLTNTLEANKDFDIYLGQVTYEPVKRENLNVFTVSTNKRAFYRYENEYRALITKAFEIAKNGQGKQTRIPKYEVGVNVNVALEELIEKIYISPFAAQWFSEIIESVRERYLTFLPPEKIIKSGIKDE
jgi:hypothetical protein